MLLSLLPPHGWCCFPPFGLVLLFLGGSSITQRKCGKAARPKGGGGQAAPPLREGEKKGSATQREEEGAPLNLSHSTIQKRQRKAAPPRKRRRQHHPIWERRKNGTERGDNSPTQKKESCSTITRKVRLPLAAAFLSLPLGDAAFLSLFWVVLPFSLHA